MSSKSKKKGSASLALSLLPLIRKLTKPKPKPKPKPKQSKRVNGPMRITKEQAKLLNRQVKNIRFSKHQNFNKLNKSKLKEKDFKLNNRYPIFESRFINTNNIIRMISSSKNLSLKDLYNLREVSKTKNNYKFEQTQKGESLYVGTQGYIKPKSKIPVHINRDIEKEILKREQKIKKILKDRNDLNINRIKQLFDQELQRILNLLPINPMLGVHYAPSNIENPIIGKYKYYNRVLMHRHIESFSIFSNEFEPFIQAEINPIKSLNILEEIDIHSYLLKKYQYFKISKEELDNQKFIINIIREIY